MKLQRQVRTLPMESFLLKFLCCPETHQSLRFCNKQELESLNVRIAACTLMNRSGKEINTPLESALIREDGQIAYPICEDIPLLLVEEGLNYS